MTLDLMRSQIHGQHMMKKMNSRSGCTLELDLMCLVALVVWGSLSGKGSRVDLFHQLIVKGLYQNLDNARLVPSA